MSTAYRIHIKANRSRTGRSFQAAVVSMILTGGLFSGAMACAQTAVTSTDSVQATQNSTALRKEMQESLARIEKLQKQLDAENAAAATSPKLYADGTPSGLFSKNFSAHPIVAGHGPEQTPNITTGLAPADIYSSGFFISTTDKSYSLYVNGLFQVRFTGFKPNSNVVPLGESDAGTANFDVFLGRMAVSGSAFSPSLKYFLQFQGSTAGNSNTVTMLDWFTADTLSKYLTVQAGRSWTPYSFEYYCNPGNYLFADLSTGEYVFTIPRAIGVQAYGQVGKLSYAMMVANSVPALDAGGQENFNTKLAYIGHVQYDILAPFGYVETDPTGAAKNAELTAWASGAYNPINASSGFESLTAGDTTENATASLLFRKQYFSLIGTGYYRKTNPVGGGSSYNTWGYTGQAGYYLVPKKFEIGGRISGANFGALNGAASSAPTVGPLPIENTWYVGPGFPYHRVAEDSVGLNYYMYGHHAKIQASYSYVHGNTFAAKTYGASRVWIQSQVMF